ncbi:PBP1A family penicillin-binding protein [Moritella marina ATCC 15381]|uniref:Penicillin-binding protein 1A n=1 Tax=Moritella marina ATCC 15381 TaxID=1202962 RepID=A0A5J6WNV1_MORMI|nr:PBP1A family penicillin-binding protein [Moritella marina]QFI39836.1 PBP1A family penicillin-binding protein [Moritella marina ATCC 15381]
MSIIVKWIKRLSVFLLVSGLLGVGSIIALYFYIKPDLPDVTTLRTVQLQTPMKVFSQDGKLISQFGEKRRIPIEVDNVPPLMIKAFLATEDNRFYSHPGIDPIGIIRAATVMIMTGERKQGASTITQQVARNFFLTREKTFIRKIKEIFLAWHIEQNLSKDEILTLYLNKIPLGYRSFGIGAAAQVYYGKALNELTLAQMAIIAGLPKAPSALNPIRSPQRAKARRHVVLLRMLDEQYITKAQFDEANNAPITAKYHGAEIELSAPYLAEMVRSEIIQRYGEDKAYSQGLNVYTTVQSERQTAATNALINNLLNYDLRHGYRGPLGQAWTNDDVLSNEDILLLLKDKPSYKPLEPAVITAVAGQTAEALMANGEQVTVSWDGLKWARPFISDKKQGPAPQTAVEIVNAGDIVLLRPYTATKQPATTTQTAQWMLGQIPDASSAFIAIDNNDGAIEALVGGFNYQQSKFNRVTQAERQIGSNIKPFVYSAGLAQGATLATLINDAPINQLDKRAGTAWRPKNSPPTYNGPTRFRLGLAQSKNVMSVRVFRQVGLNNAINYMTRFGFEKAKLPRDESLSLGSASLTPLEVAVAFATFANGGFKVDSYFIDRIENVDGEIIYQSTPKQACLECEKQIALGTDNPEYWLDLEGDALAKCDIAAYGSLQLAPRIITEQNAFLMREVMASVIWGGGSWRHKTGWNGTGWRAAAALKRHDIGGKTGTTNEAKDAWFSGFNPDLSATSWIGFDDHSRELGRVSRNINLDKYQISGGEAGAKTAQPAWIEFMQQALKGVPERPSVLPDNIVQVRIDRESGLLTHKSDFTARFEYFVKGTEPTEYVNNQDAGSSFDEIDNINESSEAAAESLDDLF